MKKSFITFCAFVLIAVQAPVADAAVTSKSDKEVRTYNFYTPYKLFKMESLTKDSLVKQVNKKYKINILLDKKNEVNKFEKAPVGVETPVKEKPVKETAVKEKPVVEKQEQPVIQKPVKEQTQEVVEKAPVKKQETEVVEQPKAPAKEQEVEAVEQPKAEEKQQTNDSSFHAFETQVVELTNVERTKAGLKPLAIDTPLMAAAREKSQDMKNKNYFSHNSPTFGSPFDRLKALGISYKSAGENIAKGQRTAQEVVTAWMNSEGHRANILNGEFTHIGVGYVADGHIWTQQFIKK